MPLLLLILHSSSASSPSSHVPEMRSGLSNYSGVCRSTLLLLNVTRYKSTETEMAVHTVAPMFCLHFITAAGSDTLPFFFKFYLQLGGFSLLKCLCTAELKLHIKSAFVILWPLSSGCKSTSICRCSDRCPTTSKIKGRTQNEKQQRSKHARDSNHWHEYENRRPRPGLKRCLTKWGNKTYRPVFKFCVAAVFPTALWF